MIRKAYAKINLGLRVLGKRRDGYHNIETIFHRIDLFDVLKFKPSSSISMMCDVPDIPTDEKNLCIRAALALQKASGSKEGAHIILEKKIPIGAGLGGGSSDAATVLLGLKDFWNVSIDDRTLCTLALGLGSDVPYFLHNNTAYATGRGEILDYFDLKVPCWILVVYPNIHVSTFWAYNNLRTRLKSTATSGENLKNILLKNIHQPRRMTQLLRNDFEPLVMQTHEPVLRLKQKLTAIGADFAQMSGSGSAVYGLFSDERRAHDAIEELRKSFQVFLTPPHFHAGT